MVLIRAVNLSRHSALFFLAVPSPMLDVPRRIVLDIDEGAISPVHALRSRWLGIGLLLTGKSLEELEAEGWAVEENEP